MNNLRSADANYHEINESFLLTISILNIIGDILVFLTALCLIIFVVRNGPRFINRMLMLIVATCLVDAGI